jgi:hypothetical protein
MDITFEAIDLAEANPTDRDAAAVITPGGTDSIAATGLSAVAAIGPHRDTRDGREPATLRSRPFDRVSALAPSAARWIVAVAAIGLTALSVALAAPASAHGTHDGGDTRHQHTAATTAVHGQANGAKGSTSPSSTTRTAAVDPPASKPATASMPLLLAGHDKCKALKGGRPGPPWCTDPSAGWEQSTLHRTDASFPTLPGAEAAADGGRSAAGRGAVHAQEHSR